MSVSRANLSGNCIAISFLLTNSYFVPTKTFFHALFEKVTQRTAKESRAACDQQKRSIDREQKKRHGIKIGFVSKEKK